MVSESNYNHLKVQDQILTSFKGGPFVQYCLNKSVKWPLYIKAHGFVATVTQKSRTEFHLGDQPRLRRLL